MKHNPSQKCVYLNLVLEGKYGILEASKLAASGFSDTSRVGAGNPSLGVDLAENNTINILNSIKNFKKNISEIEKIFEERNWDVLESKLKKGQEWRQHFC